MSKKEFFVFHKPPAECAESDMTLRVLHEEGVEPDMKINVADEGVDLSIIDSLRNAGRIGNHFPVLVVRENGVITVVREEPTEESHVREFLADNKLYTPRHVHIVPLLDGGSAKIEAIEAELAHQVFVRTGKFMLVGVYQLGDRHAVYFYLKDKEDVYRCISDTIFRSTDDGNVVWTCVPYNKRGDDSRQAMAFLANHLHLPASMVSEPNISLLIVPGFEYGD
jgi:hypothetical protein